MEVMKCRTVMRDTLREFVLLGERLLVMELKDTKRLLESEKRAMQNLSCYENEKLEPVLVRFSVNKKNNQTIQPVPANDLANRVIAKPQHAGKASRHLARQLRVH